MPGVAQLMFVSSHAIVRTMVVVPRGGIDVVNVDVVGVSPGNVYVSFSMTGSTPMPMNSRIVIVNSQRQPLRDCSVQLAPLRNGAGEGTALMTISGANEAPGDTTDVGRATTGPTAPAGVATWKRRSNTAAGTGAA